MLWLFDLDIADLINGYARTIRLYRLRFAFGIFDDVLLDAPEQDSGVVRIGLDVDVRAELASDLIITLPRQFLKFPEENKAIPTYL